MTRLNISGCLVSKPSHIEYFDALKMTKQNLIVELIVLVLDFSRDESN
jgi:hypothetical protein